jgi:hypothetical protein
MALIDGGRWNLLAVLFFRPSSRPLASFGFWGEFPAGADGVPNTILHTQGIVKEPVALSNI